MVTKQTCPNCRESFKSGKVPRAVKNHLEESSLLCKVAGCNTTFSYLDAAAHHADHITFECMLNCGNKNTLNGHNGMRTHLQEHCSKSQFKCKNCNLKKERASLLQDSHNCDFEKLKEIVLVQ